mmetsp:Transcript_6528/g.7400  ORF Transcript_6528/g.7400 Transcript_6528/m.7400 type:complete len:284 (-) Transcript_6528:94-945(-)
MLLGIHVPSLQNQRSLVHHSMHFRAHNILVTHGDRHGASVLVELHQVSGHLPSIVGQAPADLAVTFFQVDVWNLRQEVPGEIHQLGKEVLVAHVFVHGLRHHAFEPLLFDGRGVRRHFDLGVLEAVDVFDHTVAPAIHAISYLRTCQTVALVVIYTIFHLRGILQEVDLASGHQFLLGLVDPSSQGDLWDVVRDKDRKFRWIRYHFLPVAQSVRAVAFAVSKVVQFLAVKDKLQHEAIRIQLGDLEIFLQGFGDRIQRIPEQRQGLIISFLAGNGWLQGIQRS